MTDKAGTNVNRRSRWMLAAIMTAAGVSIAAPAQAAVVFSDDFSDGDRTDPAWHQYARPHNSNNSNAATTLTVVDDGGNNALQLGATGSHRMFRAAVANFDAVTLENAGDYISLTFDARWTGAAIDRFLGFQLMQSNGYYQSDTHNRGTGNFDGYFARVDVGAAEGESARLFPDNTFAFGGPEVFPGTSSPDSFAGDTYRNFELRITRANDLVTGEPTDLLLSYGVNGVTLLEAAVSSATEEAHQVPETFTFDSLAIGLHSFPGASGNLLIDNVSVTTGVIPEPASLALLAMGGLALASRRRRG